MFFTAASTLCGGDHTIFWLGAIKLCNVDGGDRPPEELFDEFVIHCDADGQGEGLAGFLYIGFIRKDVAWALEVAVISSMSSQHQFFRA